MGVHAYINGAGPGTTGEILFTEMPEVHDYFVERLNCRDNKEKVIADSVQKFCRILIDMRNYFDVLRHDNHKDERLFDRYDTLITNIQHRLDTHMLEGSFDKFEKFYYSCWV